MQLAGNEIFECKCVSKILLSVYIVIVTKTCAVYLHSVTEPMMIEKTRSYVKLWQPFSDRDTCVFKGASSATPRSNANVVS